MQNCAKKKVASACASVPVAGNVKKSHRGRGRGVPAYESEEQNERLTTKHIHTLKFLQEIVDENDFLKCRIDKLEARLGECAELHSIAQESKERFQQLHDEHIAHLDEVSEKLANQQQEQIMKKIEEKLEAERTWNLEKQKLLDEIADLQKVNKQLQDNLQLANQSKQHAASLESELETTRRTMEKLQLEQTQLGVASSNQLEEIARLSHLDDLCRSLKEELRAAEQTSVELRFRIDSLQRQLSAEGATGQEEVAEALRRQVHKMVADLATAKEKSEKKQLELDSSNERCNGFEKALRDAERMLVEARNQIEALRAELAAIRRTEGVGENFKDFVRVKRELELTRDDNRELRSRLQVRGIKEPLTYIGSHDGGGKMEENNQSENGLQHSSSYIKSKHRSSYHNKGRVK